MRSLVTMLAVAASLSFVPATPADATAGDGVRKFTFDVFLDDRAIGYQRFALTPTEDGTRIETRAEFEVKLLRITAFAYDHSNTELWQGGCLQSIDSRTDSNGKKYTVNGRVRGAAFVVATNDGESRLGDCVASFAYWDREVLLQRQRLLNSQTGEYVSVRIDSLGPDRVRIGDRDVAVERYALKGEGLDITLAYVAGGGDWVALDSRLDGGRTLRYRRSPGEFGAPSVIQTTRAGGPPVSTHRSNGAPAASLQAEVKCLTLIALVGCAGVPPPEPIKTVEYGDLERFIGGWYVIANIPTFIERGARNAVDGCKIDEAYS